MILTFTPALAALLVAITASGYAIATIGMKLSSQDTAPLGIAFICMGLMIAVLAEVALLRFASLAVVYIGIVVAESFLVLAYAAYTTGGLSMTQSIGAVMALGGVTLVLMSE